MKAPLLIEMEGRKALVVGWGAVGRRRGMKFVEAGCDVTVLTLDKSASDPSSENPKIIVDGYSEKYLDGVFIAAAATNDRELNRRIIRDARARGILCNASDDPEDSDYFFPAVMRRGDLTISVCTEGASPVVTRKILRELKNTYGEEYKQRLADLRILRDDIIKHVKDPREKKEKLREIAELSDEELRKRAEAAVRR